MIIRIISHIFNYFIWRFIFNYIDRINFLNLINIFRAQLLALSPANQFRVLRDLILNTVANNIVFRMFAITAGVNIRTLVDSRPKKVFWLSFVSTLLLYNQYLLFKKFILWPFKLGIFSFIFSLFGIDMSWFLNIFNFFSLNIPQWVYVQYIKLYGNWLNWWKGTVQIKNIKTESLPSIYNLKGDSIEDSDQSSNDKSKNKIFNRKNIIIAASVIALIGIGIWYFYYSGNGAGANGGNPNGGAGNAGNIIAPNPPAPNTNIVPHQISISDNQTSISQPNISTEPGTTYNPSNSNLIDRIENLRNARRITKGEYDRLKGMILSDTDPSSSSNPNLSTFAQSEAVQSHLDVERQDRISQLRQDRLENALSQDRLNTPSSSNSNPSSSNTNPSTSSLDTIIPSINSVSDAPNSSDSTVEGPTIIETPATPIDSNPIVNTDQPARPHSPAGSDDSSETIRPFSYGGPGERPRFAIPRGPFDQNYRRKN